MTNNDFIKVSVICPVFRARPYISTLLETLRSQTLSSVEFIFIDDKGDDGSFDIIRQVAAEEPRIVCVENTENKGVSYSRNVGIRQAKGEFIAFIDADDYISPDFYERLYNKAVENDALVVKGSCIKAYPDGREEPSALNHSIGQLYEQHASMLNIFVYDFWTGLYSRQFVQAHHGGFPESYHRGEDIFFLTCLMPFLNKEEFAWDPDAIYYYRQHPASVVHSETGNDSLAQGKLEIASKMQFLLSLPDSEEVAHYISTMLEGRLSWFIDNAVRQGASEPSVLSYLEVLAEQIKLWKNSGRVYKEGVFTVAYADLGFHAAHFYILRKVYLKLNRLQLELRASSSERCRSLREVNDRISRISSHVDELEVRRKTKQEEVCGFLQERINQNRSRINEISTRVSKVSAGVDATNVRVSKVSAGGDATNVRISKISGGLDAIRSQLREQTVRHNEAYADLQSQSKRGLQELQQKYDRQFCMAEQELERKLQQTEARMQGMESRLHRHAMLLVRERMLRYRHFYYSVKALFRWGAARRRALKRKGKIASVLLEIKTIKETYNAF